ncbi:MAG: VacJ family lipoprotein [Alphaproteobacteria bacterium]|nr:VacJ family lipoprotein [Alphaproteobacteria bacterium]
MRDFDLKRFFLAAFLAVGLIGCAAAPVQDGDLTEDELAEFEDVNDPIEGFNRAVFQINLLIDKVILRPISAAYGELPDGLRDTVRNFLRNLRTPVILANNLLQGDWEGAQNTTGRFIVNTSIGLGGLIDIADHEGKGIPFRDEDFGQTLAVWGAGEGPYLMLPLLGPSNVRDTAGIVVDYFLDPFNWWERNSDDGTATTIVWSRRIMEAIDSRSRNYQTLEDLEETSLDFYAAVRSLYRQQRENMILNQDVDVDINKNEDFDFDIDDGGDSAQSAQLDFEIDDVIEPTVAPPAD